VKNPTRSGITFLKLGGSLLSDKTRQRSFRRSVVVRLGAEIKRAMDAMPDMKILLAHGGGGFAHFPAKQFRTREGIAGGGGWHGFSATRRGVMEMNRRVLDGLGESGLHPVILSPSASVVAGRGGVGKWDLTTLRAVLECGQVPMIHGDAVIALENGFTILSTEEMFIFLARRLKPDRVILACDVAGVYANAPLRGSRGRVVPVIDRSNIATLCDAPNPTGSKSRSSCGHDVTGGMASKIECLYDLVRRSPAIEARIVSGLKPGVLESALRGRKVGTAIRT